MKPKSIHDILAYLGNSLYMPVAIHSGTGDHPQVSHLTGYHLDSIAQRRDPDNPDWRGEWIFSAQFRKGPNEGDNYHQPVTSVLVLDFETSGVSESIVPTIPAVPAFTSIPEPPCLTCEYENTAQKCGRQAVAVMDGKSRCKVHARSRYCLRGDHSHCGAKGSCWCECHDTHTP